MVNKVVTSFIFIISMICGYGCTIFSAPEPTGLSTITPNESIASLPTSSGIQETPTALVSVSSNIIANIIAHPDDYTGQQVEIIGYYRGWDLLKEVQGTPPVTRSDWVIADSSEAIYVTGIGPQGLDPASKETTTKLIHLVATVQQNQNGVFLQAISVELVSGE